MLGDDALCRKRPRTGTAYAAEAIGNICFTELGAKPVHRTVRQELEHEFLMIAQVQVVEADVHLVDARYGQRLRQMLCRRVGFQQRHDLCAPIHHAHKLPQIVRRAPHGEHNNVRTVCDGVVDLRLRVGVHRIDARHDLGLIADGGTDFCNILRCMVGLHRIHPALTLCLSQHLHVNEDAVNARVHRNFCDCRVVCDIHEFQHLISLRPSRRY